MDATKAVLSVLYDALKNDAALQATCADAYGTFPGPYHRAPVDAAWPYLTHRLETLQGVDNATRPASYTLTIWDYGDTTDRIWAIRARVMALLDLSRFTAPGQGVVRLWHAAETSMPTEDTNVMSLALVFEVRYARAGEIRNIQDTKGK